MTSLYYVPPIYTIKCHDCDETEWLESGVVSKQFAAIHGMHKTEILVTRYANNESGAEAMQHDIERLQNNPCAFHPVS